MCSLFSQTNGGNTNTLTTVIGQSYPCRKFCSGVINYCTMYTFIVHSTNRRFVRYFVARWSTDFSNLIKSWKFSVFPQMPRIWGWKYILKKTPKGKLFDISTRNCGKTEHFLGGNSYYLINYKLILVILLGQSQPACYKITNYTKKSRKCLKLSTKFVKKVFPPKNINTRLSGKQRVLNSYIKRLFPSQLNHAMRV